MSIHLASDGPGQDIYEVVIGALPEVIVRLVTQAIEQNPRLVLGAVASDTVGILQAVTSSTDVVLLGAPAVYPPPGIVSHLLSEYASLRVLVFMPQRNAGMTYWLQLQHAPLVTEDAASVVSALVGLCQRDTWSME